MMHDPVGKALWEVYEDALANLQATDESGIATATMKFILAFEAETAAAKIDLHSSPGNADAKWSPPIESRKPPKKLKNRQR